MLGGHDRSDTDAGPSKNNKTAAGSNPKPDPAATTPTARNSSPSPNPQPAPTAAQLELNSDDDDVTPSTSRLAAARSTASPGLLSPETTHIESSTSASASTSPSSSITATATTTQPHLSPSTPRSPRPSRTPSPFPMSSPRASVSTSTSSVSVTTKLESPQRPAQLLPTRKEMEHGSGEESGSAPGAELKAVSSSPARSRSRSRPRSRDEDASTSTSTPASTRSLLSPPPIALVSDGRASPAVSVISASTATPLLASGDAAAMSSRVLESATLNLSTSSTATTSTTSSMPPPSPTPVSRTWSYKGKERERRGGADTPSSTATGPTPPLSRTHSRTHSRSHSHSFSHSRSHSIDASVPEAEVEDVAAVGVSAPSDLDVRRGLRELVAAGGNATPGKLMRSPSTRALNNVFTKRRYYVLTNAGKPVLSIGHDDDETLTNMMGVAQALISIFAQDDDRPRTIIRGRTRTTFRLKPPLYLFAVSDWGEPDYVLRMHLEYINLQILSVVTAVQLARVFQRRSNFDLSRLLEGSEPYLNNLVAQCQDDLSFLTTTLQPLRMAPALRDTAAAALTPPAKFKDLLYVLLIAGGRIVTLLRPRRHTVHPSDMHLLLNTLATSATLRTVETWLPICLPKFNPAGFVHAYISFVRTDVGLVFISADRDAFEPLCGWKAQVEETLNKDGVLNKIEASIKTHPYKASVVGSPGLRHFVYKSRGIVQLTAPEWEDPYTPESEDRKRLVTLYEKVQDALFARSGQPMPLKLVYMADGHEAVLGWLTKPFELYIAVSPHLQMNAVVAVANRVAKWVNSEESRLFLKDAPVF